MSAEMNEAQSRAMFEKWVTEPPYERRTDRWPMDAEKFRRPGQYGDLSVQLAWEAWNEASKHAVLLI